MSLFRTNSTAPLFDVEKPSLVTMALTPSLIALWHPRKPKQRATFVALILLACLTTYIFIANSASLSSSALRRSDAVHDQLTLALETIQNARLADVSNKHAAKKGHHHVKLPSVKLNPAQELAAVTSFLASLPQNIIPHTVDPSLPIDPQLVLDFDTRGPRAQDEINAMVEDVWLRNPVFLYSKVRYNN